MLYAFLDKLDLLLAEMNTKVGYGNLRFNSFVSNGSLIVPTNVNAIDFLLASGAGGGAGGNGTYGGGGGAASSICQRKSYPIPSGTYKITVTIGLGGNGGAYNNSGASGNWSYLNFYNSSDALLLSIPSPASSFGGATGGAINTPTVYSYPTSNGIMSQFGDSTTPGTIPNGAQGGYNRATGLDGGLGGILSSLNGKPGMIGTGGGGAYATSGTGGKGGDGFCFIGWVN